GGDARCGWGAPHRARRRPQSDYARHRRDPAYDAGVDGRSGHRARRELAGYSVAGKTGTAQIPSDDGRYLDDAYISSFAGFVPANDPRFVVVLVLERPESRLLGTVTVMNAFRGIALDALRNARVQPDRP